VGNDILLSAAALKASDFTLTTFPNPVTDQLFIELHVPGDVTVLDMQGRKWYDQSLQVGSHSIETSQWPSGIFLVSLNGRVAARRAVE
jgi:hypothetical protein